MAAMMSLLMGMRASEIVSRIVRDLDDEGRLLWIPETKTEAGRRTLPVPEVLQPYLRKIAEGKGPNDSLFGEHWRDWPREWVQQICKAAKVPEVTAQGMRDRAPRHRGRRRVVPPRLRADRAPRHLLRHTGTHDRRLGLWRADAISVGRRRAAAHSQACRAYKA